MCVFILIIFPSSDSDERPSAPALQKEHRVNQTTACVSRLGQLDVLVLFRYSVSAFPQGFFYGSATLLRSHPPISSSFLLIHSMLFLTLSSACFRDISPAPAFGVLLKKCSIYKSSMDRNDYLTQKKVFFLNKD